MMLFFALKTTDSCACLLLRYIYNWRTVGTKRVYLLDLQKDSHATYGIIVCWLLSSYHNISLKLILESFPKFMVDRYLYTLAAMAIHAYVCLYRIICSYRGSLHVGFSSKWFLFQSYFWRALSMSPFL